MFDNEDSTNIKKLFDENIKYLEDIVSERFKLVYNVCAINFYRHALRRHNQILDIYAWCVYFKDGCKKYKFKIIRTDDPIKVLVFATKPVSHTQLNTAQRCEKNYCKKGNSSHEAIKMARHQIMWTLQTS